VSALTDIETQALALLRTNRLLTAPVDVVSFARALSIDNVYLATFDEDGIAGMIQRQNGIGTIWVNRLDSRSRQRFTVGHELGHWVLQLAPQDVDGAWKDPGSAVAYRTTGATSPPEREANQFSAAVLMPAPLVANWRERLASPAQLAAIFHVSLDAMQMRLDTIRRLTGSAY